MDITPIYELRTRLKTAMIAGTNLLQEDFRLKRAVEAIQPLLPVSPVFAKIGQLSGALLAAGQENKEGLLLDAVTLVDAVLCTQGAVAAAGELEPIITESYGTAITNAPYSMAKGLLDALENSGGGRYSYVMDARQNQPELFSDYRIKTALVKALGASYTELAEQVAEWLKEEGESVIPLLKAGFDPKGKKEMVRRAQVLDAVAKEKENSFYLEQLEQAEKEVRQTLVYALRHNPDNIDRLLEMIKSEKGNVKKAAYYALACQQSEEAEAHFRALVKKREADAIGFIELSETDWAADITAKGLKELLLPWTEDTQKSLDEQQAELITLYLRSLPFKRGEEIMECYRIAASVRGRLDKPLEGRKSVWETWFSRNHTRLSFRHAVPNVLRKALMIHPEPELCRLSIELYEKVKGTEQEADYFVTALTAKLLTEKDCCAWLKDQVSEKIKAGDEEKFPVSAEQYRKAYTTKAVCFEEALRTLRWSADRKAYVIFSGMTNPVDEKYISFYRDIRQEMSGEFTELLMTLKSFQIDDILSHCISPEDTEYRDKLLGYFYQRALVVQNNRRYCEILSRNGWRKCEGLAVAHFKSLGTADGWEMHIYLRELPGDEKSKAEEMGRVVELVKKGRLSRKNITDKWLEQFEQQLEYLKA